MITMKTSRVSWREMRSLARTGGPLTAVYAADIAMYLTDMAIAGRLGVSELAGVALAEQVIFLVIYVLGTIISLTSVMIANAVGSDNHGKAVHILQQAVIIIVILCVPATWLAYNVDFFLARFGVDTEVVKHAGTHGRAVVWCVLPFLLFILLRGFMAAVDQQKAVMATTIVAVIVNAGLSYFLTFGLYEFRGYGVAGIGIATSIVTAFMVLSLTISILRFPPLPGQNIFKFRPVIDREIWSNVFRKGTPAAITTFFEDSLFVVIGIVVGSFGGAVLAAHYVTVSIVNIGYVFANGIGDATAIRVALHRGSGDKIRMKLAGYSGVALCTFAIIIISITMIVAPTMLSSIFVDINKPQSAEVLVLSAQLLMIAAFSQVVEGVQVVTMRALRGLEDTFVPLLISTCGYWLLAFPMGLSLAYLGGLGVHGMWLGLVCGFGLTALALLWRYNRLIDFPASSSTCTEAVSKLNNASSQVKK